MLPPGAIFQHKIHQNALPGPPSWFLGGCFALTKLEKCWVLLDTTTTTTTRLQLNYNDYNYRDSAAAATTTTGNQ